MPRLLVVGHLVQDLVPGGWRLGGTAAYAGVTAARLGVETIVLTAAAIEMPTLPGLTLHRVPSPVTTRFRNEYDASGHRRQQVLARAPVIGPPDVPDHLREAEMVLLGPVAGDVDPALAALFPRSLLGACLQGWLRQVDERGLVRPLPPDRWGADAVLDRADALFLSDEDLDPAESPSVLERWAERVSIVAFTRGERGAEVCHRGEWRHIDAFPARAVDPTGAGDVFAVAFLVRFYESADAWAAARFAAAAASLVIEKEGVDGAPSRSQVEERLRAYPDIVCR
jgi:hypothetical protein